MPDRNKRGTDLHFWPNSNLRRQHQKLQFRSIDAFPQKQKTRNCSLGRAIHTSQSCDTDNTGKWLNIDNNSIVHQQKVRGSIWRCLHLRLRKRCAPKLKWKLHEEHDANQHQLGKFSPKGWQESDKQVWYNLENVANRRGFWLWVDVQSGSEQRCK